MSTPTLNVRIKHKYDTYAAWMASDLVLEVGEIAVAEIPSPSDFSTDPGGRLTPPAIGVKIGNGTSMFRELPWIQSTAGDVYAWAKEAEKPVYDADEIANLESYIAGKVQDTNTTYYFSYENDTLIISQKELSQENPEVIHEFAITLSSKIDKVDAAIEGNLPSFNTEGGLQDSGAKISDYLTISDAESTYATKTEHDTLAETVSSIDTEFRGRIDTNESNIAELQTAVNVLNGEDEGSVKKQVADAVAGILDNAPENYDTLREIADFITNDITGAAGLVNRVSEAETDIDGLLEKSHVHDNKIILDGITEERVNAWDAAGGNAEAYIDEKIAAEAAERELVAARVTELEGVVGDEANGLVMDVAAINTKIGTMEETISSINETAASAVQTVSVAGLEGIEDAVTKNGTNVSINQIPVSALVNNNMTLIFNCGNATEVI